MKLKTVTIGFSSHRPETLPFMAQAMENHDVIVLEEPPNASFTAMLEGKLPIAEYLLETDFEYPEFAHQTCSLMRRLSHKDKTILQVEPFLEVLIQIHEYFAQGGSADQFDPESTQSIVYEAERKATSALIDYYQSTLRSDFETVVKRVQEFARADAARLRLRDRMRAKALSSLIPSLSSVYVETGYIHYFLWVELRKRLPENYRLNPLYLMESIVKKLLGKRQTLGPGDVLTLLYGFHPQLSGERTDLLAARSVIFIKLLEKEEMVDSTESYPHIRNEVETIQKIQRLSFEDCKVLFPKIHLARTKVAQSIVDDYLAQI
jgi:hypothetical protein